MLTNFSFLLDIVNIVILVLLVVFVLKKNVGGATDKVVTASDVLVDSAKLPTNRIRARYLLEEDTLVPFAPEADVGGVDEVAMATYGSKRYGSISNDARAKRIGEMEDEVESAGYDMDEYRILDEDFKYSRS